MPRQIRETLRPAVPSRVYSMSAFIATHGRRFTYPRASVQMLETSFFLDRAYADRWGARAGERSNTMAFSKRKSAQDLTVTDRRLFMELSAMGAFSVLFGQKLSTAGPARTI